MKMSSAATNQKDFLEAHLRELPYFRSLVRAIEARFYHGLPLPAPTLDVGCGDGHFASVTFERNLEVGIDPWFSPLLEAKRRHCYAFLIQGDGGKLPFPDQSFASALSNSVLEHIPHVDIVLCEISRVLQAGAPFYFCVPNHQFLDGLSIGNFLSTLHLNRLSRAYRSFFNRISRHIHCDPPEIWQVRLEKAGFELIEWWHYIPPSTLAAVEWGHYFGLPALVSKWLSGRWILVPTRWNLALTRRLVERHYQTDPLSPQGVYTFFITRKKSS